VGPCVEPTGLRRLLDSGETFVVLSVYSGLRGVRDESRFARDRAIVTLVPLAVNMVTI
jgi:hypothetical protein